MTNPARELLDGAAACIKALQSAEKIERLGFDGPTPDISVQRYFNDIDDIKAVFLNCAGPLSPFQSGFVAMMAEYVHFTLATGEPNLEVWEPESIKTQSQINAYRRESIQFDLEESSKP